MLKHNVILKNCNYIHITSLISNITYSILSITQFNMVDLLIYYIESLSVIRDSNFHRKTLSHLNDFILEAKYYIIFFASPDHTLTLFTNHSFHIFYGTRRFPTQGVVAIVVAIDSHPHRPQFSLDAHLSCIEFDVLPFEI